jgi:LysR family transcriptional regulator, hydrogen peroxide-inducible genes activator
MYEGPEFRHLIHFIAVAEECNIGKAAAKLRTTQPNLTRSIKQLESGMNELLFTRGKSGSGLTAAGRALLPFARRMLDLRAESVMATSTKHSGIELPLRFGYSPFINHDLVTAAMTGFCELVPEGKIEPTSECSGDLIQLILRGELEAALVSLPVSAEGLFVHKICSENILVCLRADDPLAQLEAVPQHAVADRLNIMFARVHHPLFYDKLMRKLAKAGIHPKLTAFISAPSEMQFLVQARKGMSLVRGSTPVPTHLVTRPIADLPLRVTTAFVCRVAQQRPVLPLLAYNLAQRCSEPLQPIVPKKPSTRSMEPLNHPDRNAA